MATDQAAVGTIESIDEAATDQTEFVRIWLDAISIATNEEETGARTPRTHSTCTGSLATTAARNRRAQEIQYPARQCRDALPRAVQLHADPRCSRRFNDSDPIAKTVADIQERCLAVFGRATTSTM
jgi:hypothetical protein